MALESAWWMRSTDSRKPPPSNTPLTFTVPRQYDAWPGDGSDLGLSLHVLENHLAVDTEPACDIQQFVFNPPEKTGKSYWTQIHSFQSEDDLLKQLKGISSFRNTVFVAKTTSADATRMLGFYLQLTPRFFNFGYSPMNTGPLVESYNFLNIQVFEKYDLDLVPGESLRSRSSPSKQFRNEDGKRVSHVWHITRVAYIFQKHTDQTKATRTVGLIQLDNRDASIFKGLRLLIEKQEAPPPGVVEERIGLGRIISCFIYILTYQWDVFLQDADVHLKSLTRQCVEGKSSPDEELRDSLDYSRELHSLKTLWREARIRMICLRDVAKQLKTHPFIMALKLDSAIQPDMNRYVFKMDDYIAQLDQMHQQTETLISLVFNMATFREANIANSFAKTTNKIALLTFIFLPLQVSATILGMNLIQITGDAQQTPLWNFVVLSLSLMFASLTIWQTWPAVPEGFEMAVSWVATVAAAFAARLRRVFSAGKRNQGVQP